MAIIDPITPEEPLDQGDILSGITLYATGGDWSKGDPVKLPQTACMIISRPCAIAHRKTVAVVPVEAYSVNLPGDVTSFEDIRTFLTRVRDGIGSPDVFYLGQIPNIGPGRFRAKLDVKCCLTLPAPDKRAAAVAAARVGRLNGEFARDLHVRLFTAYVREGFDDHSWYSDDDLKLLVQAGANELAAAELEKARADAAGGWTNTKQQKTVETTIAEISECLGPLKREQQRRSAKKCVSPTTPTAPTSPSNFSDAHISTSTSTS